MNSEYNSTMNLQRIYLLMSKNDFTKRSKCNKTQLCIDIVTCINNVCAIGFIFHDVCSNISY